MKTLILMAALLLAAPAVATACPQHHKPAHRVVKKAPAHHHKVARQNERVVAYQHAPYVDEQAYSYSEYSSSDYSTYDERYDTQTTVAPRQCNDCSYNGEFHQGERPRENMIQYDYFCVNGVWYKARRWH